MKLTLEQVRHVATLARLSLSPEEERRAQEQLSEILDAVETLSEVDTAAVPPTSLVLPLAQQSRPDEVGRQLELERALANAPSRRDTGFVIPRVLE